MPKNSTLNSLYHRVSRTSNLRVPSVVEDFNVTFSSPIHGTSPVMKVQTDVYMLFNQERLDKMTSDALVNYLSNYSGKDDGLSYIRSKLNDEQLSQFVKSRYIQSPSELKSWSTYLMANYDTLVSEINSQIAARKAAEAASSTQPPTEAPVE